MNQRVITITFVTDEPGSMTNPMVVTMIDMFGKIVEDYKLVSATLQVDSRDGVPA